ncbi:TonB-dependent receptor [Pseudoteredinibacter isoporae]|uniref:Iron complex outermembrane receptor protein n=1 Tax=Pseudoteredinibacter isoporae TaxID=570281 RepID=A0A7X0JUF5_9GAMM|nr:TonB-dependent receptor [Pseudoteredinibacter isoporae]MBB6522477.1 iron complex outermembrane receptor protein [Pseudoteredinibacter isoporae]NHO88007.1 TonB-dependent receptor [Pseudoteredinibacter isoporae]NIB23662.1 TonB-dependent receptor [Pseudoteredinibacter isoporae]
MKQRSFALKCLPQAIVVMGLSTGISPQLFAQEAITLEEVTVTAQRREQSLQDVPVAVTAFSADAMEQAGTATIVDLQRSAPNTTLQVSRGTNSTLTAYVRGIGQADPLWGFEPGVGLYVDDVYFARPQAGVLDVFDVERVEVLRGPQGTLYGKNTIGGAVKYVTKKLTGEPEFSAKASVGSYGQRDLTISGQLPLIQDQLSMGVSVARLQRDGFGTFLQSGEENYNKDLLAARVSLEYTPSEDVFIRFAADKTDDDSNAKGGHRLTPSLRLPTEITPADVFDTNADMDTNNEVKSSGASLTVEWQLNDQYTFKSVSSYREGETFTNIDFDNTSLPSLHVPAVYDDDQTTQEFQLTYTGENTTIIGGLYYYKGNAAGAFDVLLGAFDGAFGIPGNFNALTAGNVDTESLAAYFHATYDISEQLSLTLGARYTRDDKEATVFKQTQGVDGRSSQLGGNTIFDLLPPATDYTNDDSWSEFSPRISMDYRINDEVMVYASYAEGFKSGGFDMRGDASKLPSTTEGYDPETVSTWEVGTKTELWDNRLRLNAALFYSDYKDVQVTVQQSADGGSNFVSAVLNAGEATIKGGEIEALAQLTEGLSAQFTLGYLDAEFDEVISGGVNVADSWEFANTPDLTSSLNLSYAHEMGDKGSMVATTGFSYRGETRIFPQVASLVDEDSYTLWDASVVWYSPDDHWTVGLYGKNLGDEEYRVGGYNFGNLGLESSVIGYYGDPRTVTLSVQYKM